PNTKNQQYDTQATTYLKPHGIGMAVAFYCGLTVQLLVTPFLPLFLKDLGFFKSLKLSATPTIGFLLALPFAALFAVFGEGIRRGWRWLRPIQIGFNVLLFFGGGFTLLPRLWQSSKEGNYWPFVTATILFIFSP